MLIPSWIFGVIDNRCHYAVSGDWLAFARFLISERLDGFHHSIISRVRWPTKFSLWITTERH